MEKTIVFDMDGTIANLYGVNSWLEDLRAYNPRPYIEAKPMYDMDLLVGLLTQLKLEGFRIVVTSWLSMESTKAYDKKVRQAKREWLARYNFPYDEIHLVKYGTPKASCTRKLGGIQYLVDDNAEIRKSWDNNIDRFSIDANTDIIEKLLELLLTE